MWSRNAQGTYGFGSIYGESEMGLADTLGIDIDEANRIMDKVLGALPQLKQAIEVTQEFASKYGYVETISGHRRRLPDAKSGDRKIKSRALRQAFNAVVQGSGSYCTNVAIILIRNEILKHGYKSRIVNTVHDSIVLDVHPDELDIVPYMAKNIMENLPISSFILNIADYPQLNIAGKYKINDTQFRFPMFAVPEWGRSYADGFELDYSKLELLGLDEYYNYSIEGKQVNDVYNTRIANVSEDTKEATDQEKERLDNERNGKLADIDIKYNL